MFLNTLGNLEKDILTRQPCVLTESYLRLVRLACGHPSSSEFQWLDVVTRGSPARYAKWTGLLMHTANMDGWRLRLELEIAGAQQIFGSDSLAPPRHLILRLCNEIELNPQNRSEMIYNSPQCCITMCKSRTKPGVLNVGRDKPKASIDRCNSNNEIGQRRGS